MMMSLLVAPSMADKNKSSEIPELAFLEFLADMEVLEGELVAPVDLLTDEQGKLVPMNNDSAALELMSLFDQQTELQPMQPESATTAETKPEDKP